MKQSFDENGGCTIEIPGGPTLAYGAEEWDYIEEFFHNQYSTEEAPSVDSDYNIELEKLHKENALLDARLINNQLKDALNGKEK